MESKNDLSVYELNVKALKGALNIYGETFLCLEVEKYYSECLNEENSNVDELRKLLHVAVVCALARLVKDTHSMLLSGQYPHILCRLEDGIKKISVLL